MFLGPVVTLLVLLGAEGVDVWLDTHLQDRWDWQPIIDRRSERIELCHHLINILPGTLSMLRSLAKEKGIDPSVMVRMWIMEHLTEMQTWRRSRGST
jgi:hypothetical protein